MPDNDNDMFDFEDEALEDDHEPFMEVPQQVATFRSNVLAKDIRIIPMCDLGSLKIIKFEVEADADYIKGSTFSLCKIPASEVRVLFRMSMIEFKRIEQGVFGWSKYKTRRQQIVLGSVDGFTEAVSNMQTVKVDSLEGIFFNFTATEDGFKGDGLDGYIVYSKM